MIPRILKVMAESNAKNPAVEAPEGYTAVSGLEIAAKIMRKIPTEKRSRLLAEIERQQPNTAAMLLETYLRSSSVVSASKSTVTNALRGIDADLVSAALSGDGNPLREALSPAMEQAPLALSVEREVSESTLAKAQWQLLEQLEAALEPRPAQGRRIISA